MNNSPNLPDSSSFLSNFLIIVSEWSWRRRSKRCSQPRSSEKLLPRSQKGNFLVERPRRRNLRQCHYTSWPKGGAARKFEFYQNNNVIYVLFYALILFVCFIFNIYLFNPAFMSGFRPTSTLVLLFYYFIFLLSFVLPTLFCSDFILFLLYIAYI